MTDLSAELMQRFPRLSKLGIAIVEALVERIAGRESSDEDRKHAARLLGERLSRIEKDFLRRYPHRETANALLQLSIRDVPGWGDAIWAFFQKRNDHTLADLLTQEMSQAPGFALEHVRETVQIYLVFLARPDRQQAGSPREQHLVGPPGELETLLRELSKRKQPPSSGATAGAAAPGDGASTGGGLTNIGAGDISRSAVIVGDHNIVRLVANGDALENVPHEARERVLEAAIEKEVCVGTPASLFVWIRRTDSKSIISMVSSIDEDVVLDEDNVKSKGLQVEFPIRDGKLQAAGIRLRLVAPEFDPPAQEKRIVVPPDGDSEVCTFVVSPKRAGKLLLTLEVLSEEVSIATRNLRTLAIEGERPAVPIWTGVAIPMVVFVPQAGAGNVIHLGGSAHSVQMPETIREQEQRIRLEDDETVRKLLEEVDARRAARRESSQEPPRAQAPSQPRPPVAAYAEAPRVSGDSVYAKGVESAPRPSGCAPRVFTAVAVIGGIVLLAVCVIVAVILASGGLR
jgi:hypothetical protein